MAMVGNWCPEGALVEARLVEEEGLRGSWYSAIVVRTANKTTDGMLLDFQYTNPPLRRSGNYIHVRPIGHYDPTTSFRPGQRVDAFLNLGWPEGFVSAIMDDGFSYSIFLYSTRTHHRLHQTALCQQRQWVDGGWVIPVG